MKKDWRLGRDQEDYMKGKTIVFKKFKSKLSKDHPHYVGDHYHCEFCWHRFMEDSTGIEDCSTEGYSTLDGYQWICEECYNDFKDMFNWIVL